MITYSDYTFYQNEYCGKIDENTYREYVKKANAEIKTRTFGRESDEMMDALKMCECEIVDLFVIYSTAKDSSGISSVNNDGYTVSFEASADLAQNFNHDITDICIRWLCYPENLILRWC